jgi:hexokinase
VKAYLKETFNFNSLLSERKKIREVCEIVVRRAGRLIGAGNESIKIDQFNAWKMRQTHIIHF